ncbi:hypothetical protein QTP88_019141 [Uroleucon formosanum]
MLHSMIYVKACWGEILLPLNKLEDAACVSCIDETEDLKFESELFRTIQVSVEGIDCAFDSNVITHNSNGIIDPVYDQFEIEVWSTDENSKSEDPITEDILQLNTDVIQIPSVSTWTSSDSVKLLRSKPIATEFSFSVLASKTKKTSASEKIANLAEEKESLVCLQKELVKQDRLEQSRELHQLKIKHMNEEYELKMLALQYECNIKKNIFSS